MSEAKIGRREFLTTVSVVGVASASSNALAPAASQAQIASNAQPQPEAAGYEYLKPDEQAFVEAVVDHMIPNDELTGSGTEIGLEQVPA
jgi:gluconate 2-dehydrogenase gamma chain